MRSAAGSQSEDPLNKEAAEMLANHKAKFESQVQGSHPAWRLHWQQPLSAVQMSLHG